MFALWFLFLGLSGIVMASAPEISKEAVGPQSLEFQVDVGSRQHVLYEPIVLNYTLRNPTNFAVKCRASLPFMYDTVKVEIEHGGKRVSFFTGPIVDGSSGETRIGPGRSVSESVVMLFNDKVQALAFPEIGPG